MIVKTAERQAFLEVMVSDKRCEEYKTQQYDCKVKLEPCKGNESGQGHLSRMD